MGSVDARARLRDSLPAIGYLEQDSSGYPCKRPATAANAVTASSTPAVSPTTTMYNGQPLPYPYPSTTTAAATSVPSSHGGYISDPRRTIEEDKQKVLSASQRQSLPSIHEALGNDNPLPYASSSASAPPPPKTHLPPPLSANPSGRGSEVPTGPPNPFSNGTTMTGCFSREPSFLAQGQSASLPPDTSRASLTSISTQDSRTCSFQSFPTTKSPTQSSKTGLTSISGSQNSIGYEYSAPASTGSAPSPKRYAALSQSHSLQSQPQPPVSSSYSPAPYESRPYFGVRHGTDDRRSGSSARSGATSQPHSESVKRHLDGYDVETALHEMTEVNTRALEFARYYAARTQQIQCSGPVVGSLPSLNEVDEMLHLQARNHDALMRLKAAIVSQERAMAEQMAQKKMFKSGGGRDDDVLYQEDFKHTTAGFAGLDTKKRRGKAAPPGRCHSCHRAETPEWRRGPDGARTLCNACGLHYAKLTRKFGAQKASSLGSNLKPKSATTASDR